MTSIKVSSCTDKMYIELKDKSIVRNFYSSGKSSLPCVNIFFEGFLSPNGRTNARTDITLKKQWPLNRLYLSGIT